MLRLGSALGPRVAGISLAGPWESRLRAPHSSWLQPPFRCHLTPLGPSPASLPLLQPWAGPRWASPVRNFSWGTGGKGFRILWLTLLFRADPSLAPSWPLARGSRGPGRGLSHWSVRGCCSSPEAGEGDVSARPRAGLPRHRPGREAERPGEVLGTPWPHPGPDSTLGPASPGPDSPATVSGGVGALGQSGLGWRG